MAEPSPPVPRSRWAFRIVLVLFFAVALPVVMSIVYTYPPAENTFYPGCFFNQTTGLHCPGCGATRCVHALLHLDIAQALAWNPLFVVLLPLILYGVARFLYEGWTGRRAPQLPWPRWGTKVILCTFLVYWVLRNIPYEPLTLLAPHKLERVEDDQPGS